MEEQTVPLSGGVSIPTPPLQSLRVDECSIFEVREFVEKNHYSKSTNGLTTHTAFKVTYNGCIVGAAIFGSPAGAGVLNKYSEGGKIRTVELRRFVLANDLPRNSESRVLAVMFRKMKLKGLQRILSYADPAFGHQGIIYKATGFSFLGSTAKSKKIVWKGKNYPQRNFHQIHRPFHLALRAALLDGSAHYEKIPGKLIYVKDLQ